MASVHEDEVGFEEGMLWCLPSHVLDEACHTKVYTRHRHQNHQQQPQQLRHHRSPGESQSRQSNYSSIRSYERAKGGAGMQAIFLETGQRSCGTGVFLPQTAGTNFKPRKKPGCAPVLLPDRVVQALNLNVQALGLQISPRQAEDSRYKGRCGDHVYNNNSSSSKKKNDEKLDGVISQNQSCYPGIFLPKEWTY